MQVFEYEDRTFAALPVGAINTALKLIVLS